MLQRLKAHWSAEAIAGRVQLDFPRDRSMRVSHETIYQWIYVNAKGGGELYRCLPFIRLRLAVVELRQRFGDWEGDTVYGRSTQHCLLTSVERKSRYLVASKISDRRAATVARCHLEQFSALPLVVAQNLDPGQRQRVLLLQPTLSSRLA